MKCFYHKSDLDGHCSGALIKIRYPNCEMIGIDYGNGFPWSIINDVSETVWMVDFGLQPFEEMIKLNQKCNLIWIDHHKTAINDYDNYLKDPNLGKECHIEGLRNIEYAACELVWKYLHEWWDGDIPKFVRLLGRYDVWDLNWDENVLPFQMGMRALLTDPCDDIAMEYVWRALIDDEYNEFKLLTKIIDDGKAILPYQERQDKKIFSEMAFYTKLENYSAIAINQMCNSKAFEVNKDDGEKSWSVDIYISFYRIPNRQWSVSLFSNNVEVDVGEIAKRYGGGGHKGAAGFQCNILPFIY